MITILLADDHGVVRQALRSLLESQPDFSIVAEASDGVETIQQIENSHPDVSIIDLMMPRIGGLEVARQVNSMNLPHRSKKDSAIYWEIFD